MKKKDAKLKAIKDQSPAAFSEMEEAAILKGMFNNSAVVPNSKVVEAVGEWCEQTRRFSIILDAALKGDVSIGVTAEGLLSFAVIKDGTDAAKLIKELAISKAVVEKEEGKASH